MEQDNQSQPSVQWIEDEDISRAPALVAALEALEASEGWKVVSRILETQAAYRTNAIVTTPLRGLDAALEQEYLKGEAAQLLTLRGLPTVLIEELKAHVKRMREDADRRDTDSDT